MSQEIIDLQIKVMHQHEEIEQLSQTVMDLGNKIESLFEQYRTLKDKLEHVQSGDIGAVDEKPPHY